MTESTLTSLRKKLLPDRYGLIESDSIAYRILHPLQKAAERSGIGWLIYNPLKMYQFHAIAARDSAAVVRSFERTFPQAKSFADVGAGSGAHSAELRRRGFSVVACERSGVGRAMARLQGVDSREFELASDPPATLPDSFDVAFSFEVAEHIPPELSGALVRFMVGIAPVIAFTAAPPGQNGTGHINLQPGSYWREQFAAAGADYDETASKALHAAFVAEGVWAPWLLENIAVFRRPVG